MHSLTTTLLIITVLVVLLPTETYAFGAGDIPDFAYLNNKAFRHGDIENILSELAKTAGNVAGGGGLFGFAQSVLSAASGGAKFSKEDVKRVYFGNWLRDYSQAMDIAGLSKLSADTLVLIVSILGFLTFGFATEEFEVTADRLGVYLPVEHIDNPKGYAEKEGDARQFHPKLRPPVNPEELEIDQRTGMKNYMATENRGWDTSTAHIRRIFRGCIEHGRRARGNENADLWEAYRLLGTGLHTMEDLLAHSNWCEIALRKMGHEEVFCHVGDRVIIDTPNGPAPPLVTGTFGSADFMHSLMGEATDHLSQASVVDLSKNLNDASQNGDNSFINLKEILHKLPIGGGDTDSKMDQADAMHQQSKAYEFNPDNIAPPEVQQQLLQLLKWRDDIYRDILQKIEMVPGLSDLIDNLTNALNAYVYTILAPYLTPLLQQVTSVLGEGSKAVIDTDDQYEVFNDPNASDPSHSLLSKDHFALILNEPAGKIAQLVVQYSVKLIVDAWFNDNVDPDQVINQILEAFHHPYYATGRSRIQQEMFEEMEKWIGALGPEESQQILQALTKDSVREGKNKRQGSDDDLTQSNLVYGGGRTNQSQSQGQSQGYGGSYGSSQGGGYEGRTQGGGYSSGGYGQYKSQGNQYGGGSYGQQQDDDSYGNRRNQSQEQTSESYGRTGYSGSYGSGRKQESSDYDRQSDNQPSYGSSRTEGYGTSTQSYGSGGGYGSSETYGSGENRYESGGQQQGRHHKKHQEEEEETYPKSADSYVSSGYTGSGYGQSESSYDSPRQAEGGYGRQASGEYGSNTYGRGESQSTYGQDEYGSNRRESRDNDNSSGYGRQDRRETEYGGGGYGNEERSSYGRQQRQEAYGGESGGYGRPEESSGRREGYGNESSYGRNEGESYGRGGYGASSGYGGGESRGYEGRRSGDDSDEEKRNRRRHKEDNDSSSYERSGYGGESYGSRGGGYGGNDETFGAERLKLDDNDNDSDEERKKHHHKKHREYDD
ncbi:von Willebrand factor A domain-containing protein 7 [Abortiporus biennis]